MTLIVREMNFQDKDSEGNDRETTRVCKGSTKNLEFRGKDDFTNP